MEIERVSGIIGVVCLGIAAIATFLLIPERELKARERIGLHAIFWVFIIYAMWIIYSVIWKEPVWTGIDKYFFLAAPFLLGLILSLLAEMSSRQPPFNIADPRIRKLAVDTWRRLPNNVRRGLQNTVMSVQAIPEWGELDIDSVNSPGARAARWYPILPFPARGLVHVSTSDCANLPDQAIAGALAREFSLAYQSTRTPFDSEAIKKAADVLPLKWGFSKESEALKRAS